jgi:hypothetical protein
MNGSEEALARLVEESERAYNLARVEVFDQVSIAAMVDSKRLTTRQREVLDLHCAADAALEAFRDASGQLASH